MTDINIAFCQSLLSSVHKLVKRHAPKTNLRTDAWVYHFIRDSWEFHGPDSFYWHGRAGNAYEARYKGWMAWLEKQNVNLDSLSEDPAYHLLRD